MNTMRISACLLLVLLSTSPLLGDCMYSTKIGEQPLSWRITGKWRPGETFYAKNLSLLNNANPEDRVFYQRHTLDFGLNVLYGQTAAETPFIEIMFSARNKGVWGNSESIAQTTDVTIKIIDAVNEPHKHYLPRHFIWIREGWASIDIGELLQSCLLAGQTFTLGAFSFVLGRGISLGDVYAVSPDYLGFSSDSASDQYAFGLKLSGELWRSDLWYDLYASYLNNQASSLGQTGKHINGQIYGQKFNPIRGFGIVAYVFASHLFWTPIACDNKNLTFEPYILYYNDPEQTVEVFGDAKVQLGTFGLAAEYISPCFECGFDTSFNRGHQAVKGIDRNVIGQQNRNGEMVFVNSQVLVNANPNGPGAPKRAALLAYRAPDSKITIDSTHMIQNYGQQVQNIINTSPQAQSQNGQFIGNVPGFAAAVGAPIPAGGANADDLYNSRFRFRDPYVNKFTGWMFVCDASTPFFRRDLKIAATAGISSGDADPNFVEKDGVYKGFIPLESVYSGKRVKSAFLLGGAGKLQRTLSIPDEINEPDDFAQNISDFTNIALVGGGMTWAPESTYKWSLNPNVLAYWLVHPDKAFDVFARRFLPTNANKFLGTELNLFYEAEFIKYCKFFAVASLFWPGQYYYDVRGKPLDARQDRILNQVDPTGLRFFQEKIPGLGTNKSWTLNLGFEYKF